jgi:hypothetical protein
MTERLRFPWWRSLPRIVIWIGLGALVGIGLGLLVGWVVWPLEYTEADPTILEEGYQRDYTLMIASAYSMDRDLERARDRLRSLDMAEPNKWLLTVTVDHILEGEDEVVSQHLVDLASMLGLYSPVMDPYFSQPGTGEGG